MGEQHFRAYRRLQAGVTAVKVLIIHAYSADNKGDGLLVDETIRLLCEAYGPDVKMGLVAAHPESFSALGIRTYRSRPTLRGFDPAYTKLMLTRARDYDVLVSVGGGFLRGKNSLELLKTAVVHGPQLVLAACRGTDSVYLPQSIGPFGRLATHPVRTLLRRVSSTWLRDDRSITEMALPNSHRSPDLAILGMERRSEPFRAEIPVVLTVRHVNGGLPRDVRALNSLLAEVDSYVQSDVGANTDVKAVHELQPHKVLTAAELMTKNTESRVVVAVRLHAALMALAAGHYVIHLAYERKGFGAFQDLGLSEYVHNVNDFDAQEVLQSIQALQTVPELRQSYDRCIAAATNESVEVESAVVASLRQAAKLQTA